MDDIRIPPTAGDEFSEKFGNILVSADEDDNICYVEQGRGSGEDGLDMIHITSEQLPKLIKALQEAAKVLPMDLVEGREYAAKNGNFNVRIVAITQAHDSQDIFIVYESMRKLPGTTVAYAATSTHFRQMYEPA